MTDATLIAADAATMSLVLNEPGTSRAGQEIATRERRSPGDLGATEKFPTDTHHSRTDPDATLARKDRTPLQLKYKVHQTIDAETRNHSRHARYDGRGTRQSAVSGTTPARQ